MQGHRASSSTVQWASSSQLNRLSSSQLHRLSSSQGHRVSSSLGHRVSFHKDTGCLLYKDTGCLLYKNTGRLLYDTVCMSSIQVWQFLSRGVLHVLFGIFCFFWKKLEETLNETKDFYTSRCPGRNRFLQTESQPCFFS